MTEMTAPDEHGVRKFLGPGGEDLGSFHLVSDRVEEGMIQIPDDGRESITFPTVAGTMRYVGPLQRGVCMFAMHKVVRILPATPDLKRMVDAFDRHDAFDIAWAFKEIGIEAVFGPGGREWLGNLAVDRGLAVRTKKGMRRR